MKLTHDFYQRNDVVQIAKELLGKYLFTRFDNVTTGGMITETEAYNGIIDKASHAYNDRRTARTEIMYEAGGTAYVYLCYGIHSLFNVVTNVKDVPHAVLIRALHPTHGIKEILARRAMTEVKKNLAAGPGAVSQALGIHYSNSGLSLLGNKIWIEDRGVVISEIKTTPRIGVAYAKEDALLPYRFVATKWKLEDVVRKII
ncbi:MAG: DNA-3-methyladenine glycosylase [Bacteroidia bacterium]